MEFLRIHGRDHEAAEEQKHTQRDEGVVGSEQLDDAVVPQRMDESRYKGPDIRDEKSPSNVCSNASEKEDRKRRCRLLLLL